MKFLWLTDVPTPYRNHSFERMAAVFPQMGIDFTVFFMAARSQRRAWEFRTGDLHYPFRIFPGLHPMISGAEIHVNPSLCYELRAHAADVVMVGGWASPTHLMAPWCMPKVTLKVLGCESHPDSTQRTSAIASFIKRKTIERYDAFLVPQRRSLDLITSLDPEARAKPFFVFPNIIDQEVFSRGVDAERGCVDQIRASVGVAANEQLWLCAARLAEEKGLEALCASLRGVRGVRLIIAGEGPLRRSIEDQVMRDKVPVHLIGHQSEREMMRLYAAADLFVLPSLRDPSPLSVVEACAAALPLLVSPRIGNFEDVLVEGRNGFVFHPTNIASNEPTLGTIANMSRRELARMGTESRAIYNERFDSDVSVRRLGGALKQLFEQRR